MKFFKKKKKESEFRYSEENGYEAEMNGILFVCEEPDPELEETAHTLAGAYWEKLPQIIAFMLDDITNVYGDISADELADALGVPEIDLDMETISWLEHTLDDCHIIEVEFGGALDEFYGVNIDG